MPISCPFQIKTLEQTEVGELVCITRDHEHPTWAIVIYKDSAGPISLAAIQSGLADISCPTMTYFPDHTDCMSFGTRWVFEVIAEAGSLDFGDSGFRQLRGGWIVRGATVGLGFGPNQREGMSGAFIDMDKFSAINASSGDCVYGRRWKLWKSAEEQARVGGSPLLENEPVAAVSP